MKHVWKHEIEIKDKQTVALRSGATILSVVEQNDKIVLYAIEDDVNDVGLSTFRVFGTGQPLQEPDVRNLEYVWTVITCGYYAWHVFVEGDHQK